MTHPPAAAVTGSWQAEAVLVAACLVAIALLVRRGGAGALATAAALAVLAVAAALGGLLFAGLAPTVGPAHDAASRAFATLGFATVAVVLAGTGRHRPRWIGVAATVALAAIGLLVPLAPVVALAQAAACWGTRSRRNALALVAVVAVIAGQIVVPAGAARLDVLHLTLAAWVLCLAGALSRQAKMSASRSPAGPSFSSRSST